MPDQGGCRARGGGNPSQYSAPGLLALFPALLSLPSDTRVAISTCRRKAKHRIVAPLRINDDDQARAFFSKCSVGQSSARVSVISTTGLRVAGVPIANDEWVQQFVQAKAAAVQVDVGKLDIISDGLIHCYTSSKTLVLGAILQHPSYPTSL